MNDSELCGSVLERGLDCSGLAAIGFMPQENPLYLGIGLGAHGILELAENGAGLVGRTVIDNDNFDSLEKGRLRENLQALKACVDEILLIVSRNKNGESGRSVHGQSRWSVAPPFVGHLVAPVLPQT